MSDSGKAQALIMNSEWSIGAYTAAIGTEKSGRHQVTWEVTHYQGRPYLTMLQIEVTEDSGLPDITASFLRNLHRADLLERAEVIACSTGRHGHDNRRRRYQRITSAELRKVADVFKEALAQGKSGPQAVAASLQVPYKTAERLIRRARNEFSDMPEAQRGPRRQASEPLPPVSAQP